MCAAGCFVVVSVAEDIGRAEHAWLEATTGLSELVAAPVGPDLPEHMSGALREAGTPGCTETWATVQEFL